jgi:hypothetical protein
MSVKYSESVLAALVDFVKANPALKSDGFTPFYDSNEEVKGLRSLKVWRIGEAIKQCGDRLKTVPCTNPKDVEKNLFRVVFVEPVLGGGGQPLPVANDSSSTATVSPQTKVPEVVDGLPTNSANAEGKGSPSSPSGAKAKSNSSRKDTSNTPCKNFASGKCKWGEQCNFLHGVQAVNVCPEVGNNPPATSSVAIAKEDDRKIGGGGGNSIAEKEDDNKTNEETPLEYYIDYLGYRPNTQEACDPELNKIFSGFTECQKWYLAVMFKKQYNDYITPVVPDGKTVETVAEEDDESDIIDEKLEIQYPEGITPPPYFDEDSFFLAYSNLAVKNICKGKFSKTLREIAVLAIKKATINITPEEAEAVIDLINANSLIDYSKGIPGDEDIVYINGNLFEIKSINCQCCRGYTNSCECITQNGDSECIFCMGLY